MSTNIEKAISLSEKLNSDKLRFSGESYFDHAYKVFKLLESIGVDDELTLILALLHHPGAREEKVRQLITSTFDDIHAPLLVVLKEYDVFSDTEFEIDNIENIGPAVSKSVGNFFDDKNGPKIIGGDFNLMPDTISVKMFEKWGYRNLIREFGIKSTRNRISWEQFKDQPGFVKQYFADYAFITKEIKVDGFSVPDLEISDHLPLVLDFEA